MQHRGDNQFIGRQIRVRRYDVCRDAQPVQSSVVTGSEFIVGKPLCAWLQAQRAHVIITDDEGSFFLGHRTDKPVTDLGDFFTHLLDLEISPAWLAVVLQDTMPVFLGIEPACPPPEIHDCVGPVSDCLVSPET